MTEVIKGSEKSLVRSTLFVRKDGRETLGVLLVLVSDDAADAAMMLDVDEARTLAAKLLLAAEKVEQCTPSGVLQEHELRLS